MWIAVNALSFQCVWLACVAGAGRGLEWLGPLVLCLHLALHRVVAGPRFPAEIRFAVIATVIGGTADSALQWLGLLSFAHSPWGTVFAPPWMLALWMGFSTLQDHALRWLHGRMLLAVVLGGAAGALSYWTGEKLHALVPLVEPQITYGAVALLWAIAMPVLAATAPRRPRA